MEDILKNLQVELNKKIELINKALNEIIYSAQSFKFYNKSPEWSEQVDKLIGLEVSWIDKSIEITNLYNYSDLFKSKKNETLFVLLDKLIVKLNSAVNDLKAKATKNYTAAPLDARTKLKTQDSNDFFNAFSEIMELINIEFEYAAKKKKEVFDIVRAELLPEVNNLKASIEQKASVEQKKLNELQVEYSSKLTETVYSKAAEKYFSDAEKMTSSLYATIILGAIASILLFIFSPIDSEHLINPILQKIFYASIFTLLVTFFLRRSTHYNRLAFQAQQTSLELEALPAFMRNVEDAEKKQEIYASLAEKYFGKELDQTQNDKIAEIVQDQAKLSVDLAKQMTEVMKDFKSVTGKPNDDSK